MTKRERVIAAIEGREVDGIPSAFSLHFLTSDNQRLVGDAGIEAHLKFFEESDTDIVKIMNEYRLPVKDVIRTPEEFHKAIPQDYRDQEFFKEQIEYTKKILAHTDKDAFSVGTLHGVCSTAFQPLMSMGDGYTVPESNQTQALFLRWNEKAMLDAMQRVTDGLCDMARNYIKESGVDGIYYAIAGGSRKWLTDEEFVRWIKPFDMQVLQAIKIAGGYSIVHICQDNVNMKRFDKDYAALADVVNWGVYDAPMSLEDGRKHFNGKTVLGGLANHSGVIVDGPADAVKVEVRNIVKKFGRKGLILGADCTLSTTQDMSLLRIAVEEARSL